MVIVGDDGSYGRTIADALGRLGHRADAIATAELARAVAALAPEVVVVVAETLSRSGREVWDRALETLEVPFVCVLGTDRLADRLAAFDAGADDVVVRPVPIPELDARLQVVLRRRGTEPSSVEIGDLAVDLRAHEATWDGTPLELTSLEYALLVLLIRNRGSVLSKGQMLEEVWGLDRVDENVVEVHISALRRKLERHGPRLIHTVRGAGYVLRPPREQPSMRLVVS